MCPGCLVAMIAIAAADGPLALRTTTYRCETCGAVTQRVFKCDDAADAGQRKR